MNEPVLIATAGHVDHGKSTLIQGLTGIDPDRWAEEKERGITIDLGYAHLHHAGGLFSFVDVPGHEKFIHNMLAGIGAIDAALLVIAADESIMPQTREHATALRFLGVPRVGIVITKVDLVEEDLLELLHQELDEWLGQMGWAHAPRVHYSSRRPETLKAVLDFLKNFEKAAIPEGPDSIGFRLAIDRVFTSPGSGTVVTGTVDRGRISDDEVVVVSPANQHTRLRQMQLHGETVARAGAHCRLALNLSGIHYKQLHRGQNVFTRIVPDPARRILIRLEVFEPEWNPSVKHWFHLHHLTARPRGRILWREGPLAAVELNQPHAFWALDLGIIRDGSPLRICAGFEVLDPAHARAKGRHGRKLRRDLPRRGDLAAWQEWYLAQQRGLMEVGRLEKLCGATLCASHRAAMVFLDENHFLPVSRWREYQAEFLEGLRLCHAALPIFDFLPLSRVRNHCEERKWPRLLVRALFDWAGREGRILISGDHIKLKTWRPIWSPTRFQQLHQFLNLAQKDLAVVDLNALEKRTELLEIGQLLTWERYFVNLGSDLLIHNAFLNRVIRTLSQRPREILTIQSLKSQFGMTRKTAIPLLEYLDKIGCTKRVEEGRLWLAKSPPQIECDWEPPSSPSPHHG